ncbi:MAG: hypothetical protein H0W02_19700 [Ktedonobacteraceae bacterium]|nr:hypothetical protein [Ktedonobacteraceae bacterium]
MDDEQRASALLTAMASPEQRIKCSTAKKLLARFDARGLHVWCKTCRRAHCVPWAIVEKMRTELQGDGGEADVACEESAEAQRAGAPARQRGPRRACP